MHRLSKLRDTAKLILAALILSAAFTVASAWTNRPGNPPADNTPPPINVGTVAQSKDGNIGARTILADSVSVGDTINTGAVSAPKFCIGSACITSWPAVGSPGSYGCYYGTFGAGTGSEFTQMCSTPGCAKAYGLGTYANGKFSGVINPGGTYGYFSCGSDAACAKNHAFASNYIWWGAYGGSGWVINGYAVGVQNLPASLGVCGDTAYTPPPPPPPCDPSDPTSDCYIPPESPEGSSNDGD